ncbi:helix-turn-helix domain-containing protein [Deinococcus aluminii]|uniref:Helix-turn-helix domain-containing protein n=1 Tax=Deinococcus aluminii TaxID=1656885 RepID=A0ABP9XGX3_9DEIO
MTSYTPVGRTGLAVTLVRETLGQQPVIAVPAPFIKMLGDCTAAAFLSQCCYLSDHVTDAEGWFEQSHEAWRSILNLSPEQIRRCLRVCAGMVEVRRKGLPARNFYRVNPEHIRERLATLQPSAEVEQGTTIRQKGEAEPTAPRAPLTGLSTVSSDRETPPPVVRQTPPPSFREKVEKKFLPPKGKDDVCRIPPASTEGLARLLDAWNKNRGTLPEASGLSTPRRKALNTLLSDCGGDLEVALALLADATREVAQDSFWTSKRFGIDTLLPKALGRAEAWQARQQAAAPTGSPATAILAEYGVGQLVTYRRERYAVEAITDRYIDLYDAENGSARILIGSDDVRSIRPLEVRA